MSNNPYDELLRTDTGPQPVASNPYDELVLQGAEADRNALIAASLEVAGQAPEQVAAGLELARDRGVPPVVALSNRDALEAERQRDRMDRLLRESPIVARWASVPENMGLAQDDLENLARLDAVAAANRQYQQDVPFTERVSARIKEGWLGLRAAFEGLLTAEAIKRGAEAGATGDFQMGFDPAGNPIYASEIFLFGDHLEQVTAATEAQGDAAVQALAEGVAPIHAEMAKLPRRPATQALLESKSFGDTWRAFAMDPLGVIGDLGVTSTVQQLPALAVTVATRNPGMAALAAGGNSSALELGNGVVAYLGQQGVDTTDANAIVAALQDDQVAQRAVAYAQTRAGIVGAFDAAAGGLASKVLIPTRVVSSQPARETLNTFVAQPTLQMLLGGTGEATAQLATEGEIRAGEVFAEAAGELFTAPVEAGTFAFDRYRQRATERAANVEQSAVDQARLNAVTEVAASLKTSERSPEAVEALVRQMREAGQEVPEAVYIDAEQARTYFQQQGLDPQKEMADLVGDAGRATEALALGGDLVVPFERWVARVAKSPHKDALQRLARFDPERLSADELASLDIDALLAEVYADPERGDEAAARAQASAADADPVHEVYMDVLGQLLGAGVERSAAEAQAQFLAQRYATRAERRGLGETAMDVYRLSGLSIEREGLGEEVLRQRPAEVDLDLDPVIDALRTGRVPTDQDIYGPSLVSALVAAGGIRPDSMGAGDLRAQDATRQRPGLLNRNGMTLDDAVVWAWENGFLDRPPTQMLDAYDDEAPDLNTLLNLIVDELGGRPTFARRNENPDRARLRRAADELGTLLSEAGLRLEELSNEQVRQFLLDGTRPQVRRVSLSLDSETGTVEIRSRSGELIGNAVIEDRPDGLQIRGIELSPDARGQGFGLEIYQRLADTALAQGKPLLSDDTEISPDAVRVWEALERRGYAIERGETAEGVPTFRAVAPPEGALGASRGGERVFEQAVDQTQTPAFRRWFGDSKVVDAQGRPLVVYHGTRGDFSEFSREFAGSGMSGEARDGFFFTPSQREASDYAGGTAPYGKVMPVFLSIRNPMEIGYTDHHIDDIIEADAQVANYLRRAQSLVSRLKGKDGLILRGIAGEQGRDLYVAFRPEQIKSAIGNRGTFDPNDPRILYQSDRPFFSALTRAVESSKQAKAPAAQWAGLLRNMPGVRQEEIEWSGVLEWLGKQSGSVTREQVVDYLRANELQVEEVVLGTPAAADRNARQRDIIGRLEREFGITAIDDGVGGVDWITVYDDFPVETWPDAAAALRDEWMALQAEEEVQGGPTRYESLRLPGGENYRELLLTLPAADDYHTAWRKWAQARGLSDLDSEAEFQRETGRTANDRLNFTDGHWSVPNVVAHVRFDERTAADGKKVLFVQELQSDWHQRGRKRGYTGETLDDWRSRVGVTVRENPYSGSDPSMRYEAVDRQGRSIATGATAEEAIANGYALETAPHNAVPDAPFKTSWPELVMKRMVRYAAENGFDRIAWPTPDLVPQIEGWGTNLEQIKSDASLSKQFGAIIDRYARDLPRIAKDLAKRLGGKLVSTKIDTGSSAETIEEPPMFSPMGPGDLDAFAGAPYFPDGSPPAIARARLLINGAEQDAVIVLDGNGVTVTFNDGVDGGTIEWSNGFGLAPPESPAFAEVLFGELWRKTPGGIDVSMWDAEWPFDLRPVQKRANFVPPPELVQASPDDMAAYGGAENFPDGSPPMVGQTHVVVDGVLAPAEVVVDGNGISVTWSSENEEIGFNSATVFWGDLGQQIPPHHVRDGRAMFMRAWNMDPEFSGSLWKGLEDSGYKVRPAPMADIEVPAIEITPEMREAVMAGLPLFQRGGGGRRPVDVQRGRIEFRSDGSARIVLTKDANLSTFLHETGHLWLDELIVDATTEGTDPQLAADLDRVLAWMGVEARAADGRDAILRAIGTEHHESWARGFEAYLREGRAPSPALRDIFARFRAWLVRLYKDITQLRVELSPEVREVMGRLIATDDEIAAAEAQDSFVALAASEAEAAELGMSPDEFRAYAEARERATAEAREQVEQDLLAAWEREAKAEYQAELQRMREAVEEEVNAEPVYRAMLELQRKDGPKLNKAELVDRYGAAFLARLPGPGGDRANRGPYIYTLSGGLGLDEAGFLFGFNSGDALVQALVNAKSRKDTIEALARERMAQFYPDPLLDGSLAERAQKAVHAGARMDVLDRELRVLARKAGVRPTQARVIAEVARQMIGRRQVRELRPREFLVAERRAAREALQAVSARQFPVAHRAKFRQALNARLYAEALAAQERVEKDRRYLQRFDKKSKREALGKAGNGYLEQIDLILDQLDLRRISGAEIDRNAALRQMDEAIADGRLVVPPDVRARVEAARRTNWRELTVDELGAMVDAVRQIDTLARRELKIVLEGERRQLEADALEVADSVLLNGDYVAPALGTKSGREKVARWGKEALAVWLRPSAIARLADGGKDRGPVTRLIIEPLRRAVTERLEPMKVQAQKDLAELYQRFYSRAELVRMSRFREHLPEIGQHWTRFDLLSLALNWGNAGNRQAVLESVANGQQLFTEAGVQQALSRLSVRDWEFVQAVWDYIDGYWPQIAEAQRRRTGLAPEKVEAAPFTIRTADGQEIEVRGGYYPLVYDRDTDANTKLDDLDDAFKRIMNGRNAKAATARGHTIERVGSGRRPVRFGINVLHSHLNQVIHDLALGDAVDYVYKVLNYGNVKAAFSQVGKLEDWKALNIWLKDTAAGELAARNVLDMGFRWLRLGFTKSKLGFNIITALLQPTGFLQSAAVVGKVNMIRGLMGFLASPVATYRQVMEASAFMRARYELNAWNKDVQDSMDALRGKFGLVPSWVGPAMFLMITQTQKAVDVTTWVAAYRVGLEEYDGDHGQAVAYADGVVENAQTSGFFSDRSAIERGSLSDTTRQSEFVRSWTTLISYMLAKGNIAYERVKSTNYRSIPQVANLAADLALLFSFESMLVALIRGAWPDEDEDWWWWLAGETAGSAASTIPFVREVPSGLKGFEVTGTPQAAFLNDIGKAATQIQQGEVDAALLKAANNVGGTLFHYPSAQMNRAIDAYWREEVEGEDVAPYEYITGRRDRQ